MVRRCRTAIRHRFSKRLPCGGTTVYAGEVLETRMNAGGWLLAQALRLIGGPLPTARCAHVPSVVTVTDDKATGGQIWTRIYARRQGFPQVVHSSKRFAGPTGLEEYVGYGVGMSLDLRVREGALIFRSRDYFVQVLGRRFVLPAWLCPGELTVIHAEVPDGRFSFTLQLVHPRFGLDAPADGLVPGVGVMTRICFRAANDPGDATALVESLPARQHVLVTGAPASSAAAWSRR